MVASYYYFILHEICGFKDVRMYDVSWEERANLTGFEPVDTTFVRKDPYTLYQSYPAPMPAVDMVLDYTGDANKILMEDRGL